MSLQPARLPTDPGLPRSRLWAQRVGAAVVTWLGLWAFYGLSGGEVQPLLLALAVLSAAAVVWGAVDVAPFTDATDWTPEYISQPPPAGNDPRFSRLSRLLSEATDRITVGDEIHRTLRALADDRLIRNHRVVRTAQPEQARQLLGDELYAYVSRPARRMRGNEFAHLSRLLTRIESL